jgi:hypothetical protein
MSKPSPAGKSGSVGFTVTSDNRVVIAVTGQTVNVERSVGLILNHMSDGELYDIEKLREIGGYATQGMVKTMLGVMSARLRDIGIEVFWFGPLLVRLRRVK